MWSWHDKMGLQIKVSAVAEHEQSDRVLQKQSRLDAAAEVYEHRVAEKDCLMPVYFKQMNVLKRIV